MGSNDRSLRETEVQIGGVPSPSWIVDHPPCSFILSEVCWQPQGRRPIINNTGVFSTDVRSRQQQWHFSAQSSVQDSCSTKESKMTPFSLPQKPCCTKDAPSDQRYPSLSRRYWTGRANFAFWAFTYTALGTNRCIFATVCWDWGDWDCDWCCTDCTWDSKLDRDAHHEVQPYPLQLKIDHVRSSTEQLIGHGFEFCFVSNLLR